MANLLAKMHRTSIRQTDHDQQQQQQQPGENGDAAARPSTAAIPSIMSQASLLLTPLEGDIFGEKEEGEGGDPYIVECLDGDEDDDDEREETPLPPGIVLQSGDTDEDDDYDGCADVAMRDVTRALRDMAPPAANTAFMVSSHELFVFCTTLSPPDLSSHFGL